jgi:deazaflavin-dependent oxidoreductase (nitroreductase family)
MTETPFTETRRFKVMRTVMGAANPAVKALLGSRFAGPMARNLMLLRFTGRNSGRTYTTPVGYVRERDDVVVVTSPTYQWWKNVREGAGVEVRLDGSWRRARARVVPPSDPEFDRAVAIQVKGRGPGMLRGFGVPVDDAGHVPADARADLDTKALIVLVELEPMATAR